MSGCPGWAKGRQGLWPRWMTAAAGLAMLPTLSLTGALSGAGSSGNDLTLAHWAKLLPPSLAPTAHGWTRRHCSLHPE